MGVLTSHLALQVGHFACFHKLSVIHVMLHYSLGWGGGYIDWCIMAKVPGTPVNGIIIKVYILLCI